MRIMIRESAKSIAKLKEKDAKQITWHRIGTFDTRFLKKLFKTLAQTGVEDADVYLLGECVLIEWERGSYRITSQRVRGDVHLWKSWFSLGSTPECNETEIDERESRRKFFRVIQGGAA